MVFNIKLVRFCACFQVEYSTIGTLFGSLSSLKVVVLDWSEYISKLHRRMCMVLLDVYDINVLTTAASLVP